MMFALGPIGELLVMGAPVILPVAVHIDGRATPEGRDHVVLFGALADVTALVPDADHGPDDTHLVVALARAELVSLAMRRWPRSPVEHLADAAAPGSVHVAILTPTVMAVAAMPLTMLAICAQAGPARRVDVGPVRMRKGKGGAAS